VPIVSQFENVERSRRIRLHGWVVAVEVGACGRVEEHRIGWVSDTKQHGASVWGRVQQEVLAVDLLYDQGKQKRVELRQLRLQMMKKQPPAWYQAERLVLVARCGRSHSSWEQQ
jgi:hypothetical protein